MELLLTHESSLEDKGTRSVHTTPKHKSAPRGGIRVKRSAVVSGAGLKGHPFHAFTGLSERELPTDKCPQGYVIWEIEGLALSSPTNPSNEEVGHVWFSHKQLGMDVIK